MTIQTVTPDAFISANCPAVFIRFHSADVKTEPVQIETDEGITNSEKNIFTGCSKVEFVGISPSSEVHTFCVASAEEALRILQEKATEFVCWHTGELYTIEVYLKSLGITSEMKINAMSQVLECPGFVVEAAEWRLIQRFVQKGKTFEYLNLKTLIKTLFNEEFQSGFNLSEQESLLKTCQIARVVCSRWITFMGLRVPGFFFFEAPKPVKKVAPLPPVLKKV